MELGKSVRIHGSDPGDLFVALLPRSRQVSIKGCGREMMPYRYKPIAGANGSLTLYLM